MTAPGTGVVLIGLPASGKSAVGRHLARLFGRAFVDTDEVVERMTGLTAAEHNIRSGDAGFRRVELDAVAEACRVPGTIIATGGGSVIARVNRQRLWRHGTVVWLDVPADVLVERLRADAIPRPALQPYSVERMEQLAEQRARFYRAADVWLDGRTDPRASAEHLAELLRAPMSVARGALGEAWEAPAPGVAGQQHRFVQNAQ